MKPILILFFIIISLQTFAQSNDLKQFSFVRYYYMNYSTGEKKSIFYNDCNHTLDIKHSVFSLSDVDIFYQHDKLSSEFFGVMIRCHEKLGYCMKDDVGEIDTKCCVGMEIDFHSKEECEDFINRLNSLKEAIYKPSK